MRVSSPVVCVFVVVFLVVDVAFCQRGKDTKRKKTTVRTTTTTTTRTPSVKISNKLPSPGLPKPDGTITREGCSPPDVIVNGTSVPDGGGEDFASVQEVQFLGVIGPLEQKRVCKIKCLNGVWVGPLCTIDQDSKKFQPMLRQCFLSPPPPDVVMSFEGKELNLDNEVALPHGSVIEMRCSEVGMYKFVGEPSIRCGNGQWNAPLPVCQPTSIQRNFSTDVAPTITYNVVSGDAGITKSGQVVILPNSIIHFDCLLQRQNGNPSWTWTATHRQYPSGWADGIEERGLKYRLSIYYAKDTDDGIFTCTTPKGHSNEVHVRVRKVQCPTIDSLDRNRVMAVEGNKMHSQARFACMEGFNLIGPEEITCTASGTWSDSPPYCEVIQCPPLVLEDTHLRVEAHNRTYGSRVMFSCPTGYRLVGLPVIICLKNQTWSNSTPYCEAIECEPPLAPNNGRVLDTGRYLTGDFLQFTCNAGFVIVGESITVCDDKGEWTFSPPICKPACEFPGEPAHGHVVPTKFHYDIGEIVTVECLQGFRVLGAAYLRCTSTGHWSSPLAHCRPAHQHS
ncbi:locomotion-related protein Hikaru genki [Parasteatoda tepidariorum]|uniref:locomotion-related protein Hikaru genki n=1 Tax=Parasteatoda tepidariorum TaxID=114398 RepID=UPI00077FB3E2|nr:locomotion-related protein Hikaru genki [Parasteatoda tepidariorum]